MTDVLTDPVDLAALAGRLLVGTRPVVLIDGGSGSGKTLLARGLVAATAGPVQLVSLDSIYPGWDGLEAASRSVVDTVLRSTDPGYRRWDWEGCTPAEWVALDPSLPLIVEGCGALTPASRALATGAIWCELDADERRRRALARDGEVFEPHWDDWAAAEASHWAEHRPWTLADVIVKM